MKNKINISIILAILVLTIFPLVSAQEELLYKNHDSGSCFIRVREEPSGIIHQYNIEVKVEIRGNRIVKVFDGRPQLPATYTYWYGEPGSCSQLGLVYNDYPNFWDLVKTGYIERTVDFCPYNIVDPTPFDGKVNLKCSSLCIPEKAVCETDSTLKRCRIDGNSIETISCDFKCENSQCIERDSNLFLSTDKESYFYSDNIKVEGKFTQPTIPETPITGVLVTAQIIKGGVIKETQAFTSSKGNISVQFNAIELVGEVIIKLSATYRDRLYEKSEVVNFVGQPINYKVGTFSYIQYDSQPVKFTVEMKDLNARDIYPDKLKNLRAVASLSGGQVGTSNIEYKGNGLYEISSAVSGSGVFAGKVEFDYQGTPQSSPIIEITIDRVSVNIDISEIDPTAKLKQNRTYTIKVFDSFGNKINPDNLWVSIKFPDGATTDLVPFERIKKVSEGVYEFYYTFPQVEKFTFDIFADKAGMVRGSAKVSVAVSGDKEATAGPAIFGQFSYLVIGAFLLLFLVAYLIYRRVKR